MRKGSGDSKEIMKNSWYIKEMRNVIGDSK